MLRKKILRPEDASLPGEKQCENALPKMLAGSVHPQWVRCGRPGCRCAQGRLHGPYFYRFYREGDKLRKQYISSANVEEVVAACAAWQVTRSRSQLARVKSRHREEADRLQWRTLFKLLRHLERGEE
jgi:hypothetical protein